MQESCNQSRRFVLLQLDSFTPGIDGARRLDQAILDTGFRLPQTAGHTCSGDLWACPGGWFLPVKYLATGRDGGTRMAAGRRTRRGILASWMCVIGVAGGAGSGGCRRGFCRCFVPVNWCEETPGHTCSGAFRLSGRQGLGASGKAVVSDWNGHKPVARTGAIPPRAASVIGVIRCREDAANGCWERHHRTQTCGR